METKDSNKSSFARVRVQESQSSVSPVLSSRSQYLKLLYPNPDKPEPNKIAIPSSFFV